MKRTAMPSRTTPMRRTAFKTSVVKLRANQIAKAPKRMKHGKVPPTAAESAWMALVAELGCIVCLLFHGIKTPCAVHHLVKAGRRLGHFFTIGLCDPGHHQNTPNSAVKLSRHPNKARFESAYGTEEELLEKTQEILNHKGSPCTSRF